MTFAKALPLLAALAAALVAAGCGGDGDDSGVAGLQTVSTQELTEQAQRTRDDVVAALQDVFDAQSADDLSDRLVQAAEALRTSADRLDDVESSGDAADAQSSTVDAIDQLAADLEQASQNVEQGDFARIAADLASSDAITNLQDAFRELQAAGVDVDVPEVDTSAVVESAVGDARAQLEAALGELGTIRTPADASDVLGQAADSVIEAADRLGEIEASGEVQTAKEHLAAALNDFAADLQLAASDVSAGNYLQVLTRLQSGEALEEVRLALEDLRAAGVDVQGLPGG